MRQHGDPSGSWGREARRVPRRKLWVARRSPAHYRLNVDESKVREWFAEYLSAFAALGRGQSQPADVAAYYGVPLLVTTDEVIVSLKTRHEVAAWLQTQADAMVAAHYDHTEMLANDVAVLNRHTAVHRAQFSRQRADGTEINHMSVSYVITRAEGLCISALLLHSP